MIINTLDFNEELFQAVGTPRLHHQLMPNELGAEIGFDPIILKELAKRGHKVSFIFYKGRFFLTHTFLKYRWWKWTLKQRFFPRYKPFFVMRMGRWMQSVIQENRVLALLIKKNEIKESGQFDHLNLYK